MKKTILVAFAAAISYFVTYIILRFSLQDAVIDWHSALSGAIAFWLFIFVVHHFLGRTKQVPW
ncbi:MAG: hypothetical protein KKI06_12435 [Euryarchaeota archaeon]|nr:hypothetical protein [Euryarchaeota archaeon]